MLEVPFMGEGGASGGEVMVGGESPFLLFLLGGGGWQTVK